MKTSLVMFLFASVIGLSACGDDDDDDSSAGGASGAGQDAGAGGSEASADAGSGPDGAGVGGSSAGADGEPPSGSAGAPSGPSGAGAESGGASGAGTVTGGSSGAPAIDPGGTGGTLAVAGSAGTGGSVGGTGPSPEAGAGGTEPEPEPEPEPPLYEFECQASERAFVRRAILGILGRNPVSQAEVSLYTDLIQEIDESEGFDPNAPRAPGSMLRASRRAVLAALFAKPEYASNWEDLYRDFLRVQRVDEQENAACFGLRARPTDAAEVAVRVRDVPPTVGAGKGGPFTMADVIAGSIAIDDMRPIYSTNLFAMMTKSYLGANAEKVALELSRRRDFGAWFDAVYLNRDTVCLACHNSEFSVTQTADPATNRHYPLPGLLEKSLFGSSTGPLTYGGYEAGDRLHAALRFTGMVNDCAQLSKNQVNQLPVKPVCPTGETIFRCRSDDVVICSSDERIRARNFVPWGWATACGQYIPPQLVPLDIAFVEARFGNVNGLRATTWDVWTALTSGFTKLRDEGLGVAADGTVADPDKAFAYLTAMNIAEKVWREIVGTPLTIPTYFPRNAASRDQLQLLTETFIDSNYSNKALISEIFASPYVNLAAPDLGCGAKYGGPRIFDPWVTAEDDPAKRGNSSSDGAVSMSSRTAARAAYSALKWPLAAYGALFPGVRGYGQDPIGTETQNSGTIERQFQGEIGFFLKNAEPGFRGLDFQARLGWEDRMGRCDKLAQNTEPDLIDELVQRTRSPGVAQIRDLIKVLKDRLVGNAAIEPVREEPALAAILGASLDTDAANLTAANASLRRVCGALVSSPQFLMIGVAPAESLEVPLLTPAGATYGALCEELRAKGVPGYIVTCAGNDHPLMLSPSLSRSNERGSDTAL